MVGNLAYDPLLGQTVALAGAPTGGDLNTYAWDGVAWSQLNVNPLAATGGGYRLVFDGARQELDLLTWTGPDSMAAPMDLLVLKGGQWTKASVKNGPIHRDWFALAYDQTNKLVVLYGGRPMTDSNSTFGDTWTWDGGQWTQRTPKKSPPPGLATMAYDAGAKEMVMLQSAWNGTNHVVTAWTWSGSNWVSRAETPAAINGELVYDGAHPSLVHVGPGASPCPACTGAMETWVYAGGTWARRQ